ncbi:MAG: hypothetical protein IT482_00655 [Gammaproteobacteria bacterium]|jgi:hypothetical protein|nr:hypothetical protein [Gammaproteobacteria bacterium]
MKKLLVTLLAISLVATGCTTTRMIAPGAVSPTGYTLVEKGDRAKLLLKSGQTRNLKITSVDDKTLVGKEGRGAKAVSVQIALADVQSIELTRTSGARTGGLVVGILLTAAAGAAGILMLQCGVKLDNCGD